MDRIRPAAAASFVVALFVFALSVLAPAPGASAQSVADFYRGKQISWILSADAGGGYSSYALAFAPYLTAHLPGNPTIIVQNMPGAGGLRAMLYLNSRAPRDGTTIAMVHSSVPFAPLYGIAEAKFDPRQMNWIGSIDAAASICVVWHTSPVKIWQDALEKEFTVGGSGAGSHMETLPAMLNKLFGTKMKGHLRLQGRQRHLSRDGAWRGRRPLRGFTVVDQLNTAELVSGEEGRDPIPDRA